MKNTLFLHIGSHKTGSTSIQEALYSHRSSLEKNGLYHFKTTPEGNDVKFGNISGWIKYNKFFFIDSENLAEKIKKTKSENVIISTEGLFWLNEKSEIKGLIYNLQKIFKKIVVIAYLRRQDKQLFSHYLQSSKDKSVIESKIFGSEISSFPSLNNEIMNYLDYNKKLSTWRENLRENDRLITRNFEKEHLINQDVVSDFFQIINIKKIHTGPESNKSPNIYQAMLGHYINKSNISHDFQKIILRTMKDRTKIKPEPQKEHAYKVLDKFKESNILLGENFKIFFSTKEIDTYNNTIEEKSKEFLKANPLDGIEEILALSKSDIISIIKDSKNEKVKTIMNNTIKKMRS